MGPLHTHETMEEEEVVLNVTLSPTWAGLELEIDNMIGLGKMFTMTVAELVQPFVLVRVTV